MKRTWVLLFGAALLWVCACAGAQEYTEPSPGDGDVPPEVTDPGSEGGGENLVLISGDESGNTEGGYDVTSTALDRQQMIFALLSNGDVNPAMPEVMTAFANGVGLPEGFGLPVTGSLNLVTAPEVAQVHSGVGLSMAEQIAAFGNGIGSLPDFLAGLDSSPSQLPIGTAASFAASRFPDVAGLLGNQ